VCSEFDRASMFIGGIRQVFVGDFEDGLPWYVLGVGGSDAVH
jgi:hypothetical protein